MEAWDWVKRVLGVKEPITADELAEDIEYASEMTRQQVRGGYETRDDIVDSVFNILEHDSMTLSEVKELVDTEINSLKEEQVHWPSETDYDRLVAGLKALDAQGIVARENFTCCGTCGTAEIWDEIDTVKASGKDVRGYVFFHQQGTEHAVEGYGINFSYGSAVENATEEQEIAIAQALADEMRSRGFKVDWNGKLSMCVMVELDWKRRWTDH